MFVVDMIHVLGFKPVLYTYQYAHGTNGPTDRPSPGVTTLIAYDDAQTLDAVRTHRSDRPPYSRTRRYSLTGNLENFSTKGGHSSTRPTAERGVCR